MAHRKSIGLLALAGLIVIANAGAALAHDHRSPRRHHGQAGQLHPDANPNGPGVYYENGVYVYAGPNCYVSREQVLQNGRLVWRPLSTCLHGNSRR